MNKLSEIEVAIDALPPADQQELLLFLAARLRKDARPMPQPRQFSVEQLQAWIDDDEADLEHRSDIN